MKKETKPEFPLIGTLAECSKCGRKILVERKIRELNHTLGLSAVCWKCLDEETQQKAKEEYDLEAEV